MAFKSFFSTSFLLAVLASTALHAGSCFDGDCGDSKVCGKVEIGPAYVHVDLLDEGRTTDRMDLPAVKADACWAFWKGVCIKPTIMWGKNDKQLFTTGVGLGHITPIVKDTFYLTPVVGMNYTYLQTDASIPQLGLTHLTQKFRSYAPYLALEATWNFAPQWRLNGLVQYAWTRNRTTISNIVKVKEWSQGWNYGLQIERDITKLWSVNLGGAYNSSMTKEKRGMRGYGFKLGLVRWF